MSTSNPQRFPRWIERPDGARIIVHDHHQMSTHMGEEFDANANPVAKSPVDESSVIQSTPDVPDESEFAEPFYPPERLPGEEGPVDAPFDLDTPIDLDPLGIFEPAADEPAGAAPKRTRKKKSENGA